jgi:hypothetical protein
MTHLTVSRLHLIHSTSQHSYLVETSLAERLAKRLEANSDVEGVQVVEATDAELKRYQHWEASTKTEEWFRVTKEQFQVKLVPATAKDVAQPSETSLMMAIYGVGRENLLNSEPAVAPTAARQHKLI